jgi:ribosomal protein S2
MADKNTNPDDVKVIVINNKDGTKSVGIQYKDRFGKIIRGKVGLKKDKARENWNKYYPHLPYD